MLRQTDTADLLAADLSHTYERTRAHAKRRGHGDDLAAWWQVIA